MVEVKYLKKLPTLTPKDSFHLDDWFSAVQTTEQYFTLTQSPLTLRPLHRPLTGCDINIQHLWYVQELAEGQGDRAHCLTIPAHHAPDKFVTWVHAQAPLQLFSRRGRQLESV
ncbi:ribosome biogenesis protein WDR12 homolog [Scylla paramamosain]|uniref:ribosome biogenesis protein WDR12 homolog n=1 Tax=Scylla paramamosain TaxID=85552 RepID=UPI0030832498